MTQVHNRKIFFDRRKDLRKNQTKAEQILWNYLRGNKIDGWKFKRQHSIGPYIVDFYCANKKLILEIDGDVHFLEHAKIYDEQRTNFFVGYGMSVLRFTNDEIYFDIDNVLSMIKDFLSTAPNPSLQMRGE